MAMEVAVDDKDAQRFLKKNIKNIESIKKGDESFVGLLSTVVFQDYMDHFRKEEGPDGPWTKWSEIYTDHMLKIGKSGNKILQDTGRLRQSFVPTNYKTTREGILWFNPAKTNRGFPYAAAHQEGGNRLPARKFMWLSDVAKDKIEKLTLKFIEDTN